MYLLACLGIALGIGDGISFEQRSLVLMMFVGSVLILIQRRSITFSRRSIIPSCAWTLRIFVLLMEFVVARRVGGAAIRNAETSSKFRVPSLNPGGKESLV